MCFATGLPVFMVNTNTWQTSLSLQSFNLEVPVDDHERIEKVRNTLLTTSTLTGSNLYCHF